MTCYICKDEPEVLYKICSCADSLLCIECLELSNNNINGRDTYHENMLKCSICRQFLEFNYYNNKDYYKNVVTFHLMKFLTIGFELMTIFYIYYLQNQLYPTKLYANPDFFLGNAIFQVWFLRYTTKCIFIKNSNTNHEELLDYQLDSIYIIFNILFFIILYYSSDSDIADLYTVMVLMPLYYVPFLFFIMVDVLLKYTDLLDDYQKKYTNKNIKVKSVIYNNVSEV